MVGNGGGSCDKDEREGGGLAFIFWGGTSDSIELRAEGLGRHCVSSVI